MATQINVNLDEVIAWVEIAQQMPEMTEREAMIAMRSAVQTVEREVKPITPVNTGALKNAWSTKVSRGSRAIKGEIANPKEYALPIEKGRSPGTNPPVDAIQYWVTRKFGVTGKEARGLAFHIQANIKKRGFKTYPKGAKMLEKGFDAAEPTVRRIFDKVPEKVFNRLK